MKAKTTIWKKLLQMFICALGAFALASCDDNDVDDAADEVGDAIEDAGDKVEEAADDVTD